MPWREGPCACVSTIQTQAHPPTPRRDLFSLGSSPLRRAVSHAGMAGAVGKTGDHFVSAKNEIRGLVAGRALAHRPAAFALLEIEQRARLRRLDESGLACVVIAFERRVG